MKKLIQIKYEVKNKCQCEYKHYLKHHLCEKDYPYNSVACNCEINKYFKNYANMKNLTDDSLIKCDKIIDAVANRSCVNKL